MDLSCAEFVEKHLLPFVILMSRDKVCNIRMTCGWILKKMTKTGHLWAEKYFALLIKIDVPMVFISFGGNCCVSSLALDPFSLTFYR